MMNAAVRRAVSAASHKAPAFRKEFSTLVVATEEYPGLPSVAPEQARASNPSVTTLKSGLVVVTEDVATTSTVTMTFPKAGSASEEIGEAGAALINKCLAFNSGSGLSTILINRTIEDAGAMPFATLDRQCASLGYTVEPDNAVGLIPLLATDCTFEKWDVRDAKKLAAYQVGQANKDGKTVLSEHIFAAAYGPQSTMGRPLYCADAGTYEIASFRSRGYGLNGAVLAATGVSDHSAFCTQVEELLSEAPAGSSEAPKAAPYLGGESRLANHASGYAHVALAFDASVSAPMKGVLKHFFSVTGGEAGVAGFVEGGLVGAYAGAVSGVAGALDSAITNAMLAKPTAETVARAKSLAKAEALFAMDCGSVGLAETLTAQVMDTGSPSNAAALSKAYDSITEKDVTAALATVLKTKPSLAAVGDISLVPYQGTFASRF